MLSYLKKLFWLLLLLNVVNLHAQNKRDITVDKHVKNKQLSLVLLDLSINNRLRFDYSKDLVSDVLVSANISKQPIETALTLLLRETDLSFQWTGERTILINKGPRIPSMVHRPIKSPKRKDFELSGVIKDATTGETLPFAEILIGGTTNGSTTNLDGYFTLFKVPNDTVTLELHYLGYQTAFYQLDPEQALENILLKMEPIGTQLDEVIVVAQKEEQLLKASSGVSKISVAPAQLAALPSLGEKDIFRSLQLLPGVSGSNESSSGLYVRGGTLDQNLVLFDGFTVYHVDHLYGFYSAFNANAIKDVQLYKGGFEAKFGGRLSSVVEITGKDGNAE
ncbi:MAG: carboxypeptidase-like regulatory domain-containing protein, partial [Bacteroidota bacterium]